MGDPEEHGGLRLQDGEYGQRVVYRGELVEHTGRDVVGETTRAAFAGARETIRRRRVLPPAPGDPGGQPPELAASPLPSPGEHER